MLKTPQEFKRDNVKTLFDKVLGETKTKLTPLSISISEGFQEKSSSQEKIINLRELKARGFVDGIFLGLRQTYCKDYHSLDKIKLVDLMVNPIMKASTARGSDAKTSVIFRVEVNNHGISEFQHKSRSMIHSSFMSALSAFQFYINCERTFYKIKLAVADASARNRGDILQSCLSDLSVLTEVNTYDKK